MSWICFVVLTNEKHWLLFSLEILIINCLIVATEQPPFCFYFGTISINSSLSHSWLYSQPLTSQIIIRIVGMLRNPAQGRSLGGRYFTLSVLLIQQRMREGAEWELSQAMQFGRCRTENTTHTQQDQERPPKSIMCSMRCRRSSPSAESIPLCRSGRWELRFWHFPRASLEKSFVLREHFQELLPTARVLEIKTLEAFYWCLESNQSPCQQTEP